MWLHGGAKFPQEINLKHSCQSTAIALVYALTAQ